MENKRFRKFMASVLTLCMLSSCMPVGAMSDEAYPPEVIEVQNPVGGEEGNVLPEGNALPEGNTLPEGGDVPAGGEQTGDAVQPTEAALAVQEMFDALPAADELAGMRAEEYAAAYEETQAAYSAYLALTAEEQATVNGLDNVQALLGAFSSAVATTVVITDYTIGYTESSCFDITVEPARAMAGETVTVTFVHKDIAGRYSVGDVRWYYYGGYDDEDYYYGQLTSVDSDTTNGVYTYSFEMPAHNVRLSINVSTVWEVRSDGIMYMFGYNDELPDVEYTGICVAGELDLSDDTVVDVPVCGNGGTISGGHYTGGFLSDYENGTTIKGGVFDFAIETNHYGAIYGGTFNDDVLMCNSNVYGGTFNGNVDVKNIEGGDFAADQEVNASVSISGGTFAGTVYAYKITGGTFNGTVYNYYYGGDSVYSGTISGGTFTGEVSSTWGSSIIGGTFGCRIYVSDNEEFRNVKLVDGINIAGDYPDSVIHNVNGVDTEVPYGGKLLAEGALGVPAENVTWFCGGTQVTAEGAVPLVYAAYTSKVVYAVTADEASNGTVSVSAAAAEAGETVTVTVTPEEGYKLKKLTVDGADVTAEVVEGVYTFVMPANAVSISAEFAMPYEITWNSGEGVTVTVDKRPVNPGESVTFTFTFLTDENGGYGLDDAYIYDFSGVETEEVHFGIEDMVQVSENTYTYTFTPEYDICINVLTKKNWYIEDGKLYICGNVTALPAGEYSAIYIESGAKLTLAADEEVNCEVYVNGGNIEGGVFNGPVTVQNGSFVRGSTFNAAVYNYGSLAMAKFNEGSSCSFTKPMSVIHNVEGTDMSFTYNYNLNYTSAFMQIALREGCGWCCNGEYVSASDPVPLYYSSFTQQKVYDITVSSTGGYVGVNVGKKAAPGQTVTVTLTVAGGYIVNGLTATCNGAALAVTAVDNKTYTFTMPEGNVNIEVSGRYPEYGVALHTSMPGHNVTFSASRADEGEEVTVYITRSNAPGDFRLEGVRFYIESSGEGTDIPVSDLVYVGEGEYSYTFTMPASDVNFTVKEDCNWMCRNNSLYVYGKLEELPEGCEYDKIYLCEGGDIALQDDVVVSVPIDVISDDVTISGGKFTNAINTYRSLTITGGIFEAAVTCYNSTVSGGTFEAAVYVNSVSGGTFNGNVDVKNIEGGDFAAGQKVSAGVSISGGTFAGTVYAYKITGGTFNGTVYNYYDSGEGLYGGTISGGTFTGEVSSRLGSSIIGGTFGCMLYVSRNEEFRNVKLLEGVQITGEYPTSVIHNEEATEVEVPYDHENPITLLSTGVLPGITSDEGWYTGNTRVTNDYTVPYIYHVYAPRNMNRITVSAQYGTVTPSYTYAASGETIDVTVTPNNGYALVKLTMNGEDVTDEVEDGKYILTMPAVNVEIVAEFKKVYTITCVESTFGSVEADVSQAFNGDTVTVTITPKDDGTGDFFFESVYIWDTTSSSGGGSFQRFNVKYYAEDCTLNEDGSYVCTFTMPNGNVKIDAAFDYTWYIMSDRLCVHTRLTELPEGDYSSIFVYSEGELALSDDTVVEKTVTLADGVISGGNYASLASSPSGTISGGVFNNKIAYASLDISGGTFNESVHIYGTVSGGTFEKAMMADVYTGGTFNGEVSVINGDEISGGVFNGIVRNGGVISGGTFNANVYNYFADVMTTVSGIITGGEFGALLDNSCGRSEDVTGVRLNEGARVNGDYPASVVHSVNGIDTVVDYSADDGVCTLYDALNAPAEGYVWLVNGEIATADTEVPLIYSEILHTRNCTISVDANINNGTVTAPANAFAGSKVTITVTADTDCVLLSLEAACGDVVIDLEKGEGNTYTFTMPDGNVVISAEFEKAYKVKVTVGEGGIVSYDKISFFAGETVTMTVTPEVNDTVCYEIKSVDVRVSEDNNNPLDDVAEGINGLYMFEMPASDVNVKVEFNKIWEVEGDVLFIYGKVTELPDTEFDSVSVALGGELDLSDSEPADMTIVNSGLISGGTYEGYTINVGTIGGGEFNGRVQNNFVIGGGEFNGEVVNAGNIEGGSFTETSTVTNKFLGNIEDGKFEGEVINSSTIEGGEFSGSIENNGGSIEGIKFTGDADDFTGDEPASVILSVDGKEMTVQRTDENGNVLPLYDVLPELETGCGWYQDGELVAEDAETPVAYTEYTAGPVLYTVTVDAAIENGTVTVDPETYYYDDEVVLDITVNVGCKLVSLGYVLNGETYSVPESGEFTMPAGDIVIVAEIIVMPTVDIEYPAIDSIVYGDTVTEDMFIGGSTEYGTFEWNADVKGAMLNAGTHTAVVEFIPYDTETYYWAEEKLSQNVTIEVKPFNATITVESVSKVYGEADPEVSAEVSNLPNDDHIAVEVTREAGENAGEYNFIVSYAPDGNYDIEELLGVLTITPRDIADAEVTVSPIADETYTGAAVRPVPTVKFGGAKLVKGKDFTVSYYNNTEVGTARVTVTGIGNFSGSVTASFEILPAPETETEAEANEAVVNGMLSGTEAEDAVFSIVFDAEGAYADYTMEILANETEDSRWLVVTAVSDEETGAAQHSMVLTVAQLMQMADEQHVDYIVFENDGAVAMIAVADIMNIDLTQLPDMENAEFTADDLANASVEIRITPVETDKIAAFEVSVWMKLGDMEIDISSIIPSFTVGFCAKSLITEATEAAQFTVDYMAVDAEEAAVLESTMIMIPGELNGDVYATGESISATFAEDMSAVEYAAEDAQQHCVLAAAYAGEGVYTASEAK